LKILFVHEVSYRKKVAYEMHEFPELLSLRGHAVSFLEFDEGQKFWQRDPGPRSETIGGRVYPDARIHLHRSFQLGVPGLDRLLAVFSVFPTLRSLMSSRSFDAVVLYAVPTFGLQTLWACRTSETPILFRALDVSHKIRRSLFSPLIKRVEALLYQKVDVLSANNAVMEEYCKELGRRDAPTIVQVPPVDLEHFRSTPGDEDLRRKLGIRAADKVIVYLGSFFYFSGLVETVREFARIVSESPGVKLLLVGGGSQEASLKKKVKELGISGHVIFAGFIPYASLPKYLGLADVAINPLKPSAVSNLALPNKVLQYLSAGIPTVSTKLEGLMTTFPFEPGLFWAEDPKSVIKEAAKIAFTPVHEDRQEIGQADNFPSKLVQFSHHTAVSEFENGIASMVRLKGR